MINILGRILCNLILMEGIKVKAHLKIIKWFGPFILLFLLVSAVAVSDNTYKVSVTIVQSSSSGKSDDANTVINTYTKESESPETHVTSEIHGSDSSLIINEEDTTPNESTDSEESGADDNLNPSVMPDFQLDELTPEEYNNELLEWVWSMLDEDLLLTIDDFP